MLPTDMIWPSQSLWCDCVVNSSHHNTVYIKSCWLCFLSPINVPNSYIYIRTVTIVLIETCLILLMQSHMLLLKKWLLLCPLPLCMLQYFWALSPHVLVNGTLWKDLSLNFQDFDSQMLNWHDCCTIIFSCLCQNVFQWCNCNQHVGLWMPCMKQ